GSAPSCISSAGEKPWRRQSRGDHSTDAEVENRSAMTRRYVLLLLLMSHAAAAVAAGAPATLRVDYYHTGNASEEILSLDRILGDGYAAAERGKFERDARRLVAVLLATSPFKERQSDINVWGLCPAAAESGVSRPSQRIYRRSPAGATYDAFDSERYVLTFENRRFRDIAANAPYEVVEILVNSATYGGGGIFGLYSTVAADSAWAPYIFV